MSTAHPLPVRPGRDWKQRAVIATGVALTVLCVAAAGAVGYGYWRFGQIIRFDLDLPPAADGAPENFLLVGSDSRENLDPSDPDYGGFVDATSPTGGQRTDTIMILRVDPSTETADLLSLPRDLFVPIRTADGPEERINTAYSQGRQVLIDTIQNVLGIPINHYVEVDFAGFKDLVGAIGGVTLHFDTPLRDVETGLRITEPGCQTLDASQALAFVRSRKLEIRADRGWTTDPSADLGRISRQQLFIRAAIKKAVGTGLTNPVALNDLVDVGVSNVGLDPGLSVRDLLSLGRRFASFDENSLRTHTVAVTPFRTSGGAAVLDLDEEDSEPVLNIFRGLPADAVSARFIDVTVLNGTGAESQATDVAAALGNIGFRIAEIGDAAEPFPRTVIFYPEGSEEAALNLVSHLTSRAQLVEDDDLDRNELIVVTGPDFTTVHQISSPEDLSRLLPTSATSTTAAPDGGEIAAPETPTTPTTDPVGYTPDQEPAVACS